MAIRKNVTVTANGEEYMVKELTVVEIIGFIDAGGKVTKKEGEEELVTLASGMFGQVDELLAISIPGIKVDALKAWAPSEIGKLYDAFKEVNAVFFGVAQRLGLNNLIAELEKAVAQDFSALFANLLKQDTPKP